jgi:hypothetical protein
VTLAETMHLTTGQTTSRMFLRAAGWTGLQDIVLGSLHQFPIPGAVVEVDALPPTSAQIATDVITVRVRVRAVDE